MPQLREFTEIWIAGGWVMLPLLFLSFLIYGIAVQLWMYFSRTRFRKIPDSQWMAWIEDPSQAQGEIGDMIRYTQSGQLNIRQVQNRFFEINASRLPSIDQRLNLMSVLVASAPLLGLLGTVLGMLTTFDGISVGGSKTTDVIARGISEALITTEMGLLVAVPGYVFISMLKSRRNEFVALLARIESQTIQKLKCATPKISPPNGPTPSTGAKSKKEATDL
jgi:biopolymer transport protein ExbB